MSCIPTPMEQGQAEKATADAVTETNEKFWAIKVTVNKEAKTAIGDKSQIAAESKEVIIAETEAKPSEEA